MMRLGLVLHSVRSITSISIKRVPYFKSTSPLLTPRNLGSSFSNRVCVFQMESPTCFRHSRFSANLSSRLSLSCHDTKATYSINLLCCLYTSSRSLDLRIFNGAIDCISSATSSSRNWKLAPNDLLLHFTSRLVQRPFHRLRPFHPAPKSTNK